jgi:dihydroorotase
VVDLLLKRGRVVDPASRVDGVRDVAVSDGRIAAVAEDLSPDRAKRVLDVRDQIVCPV